MIILYHYALCYTLLLYSAMHRRKNRQENINETKISVTLERIVSPESPEIIGYIERQDSNLVKSHLV